MCVQLSSPSAKRASKHKHERRWTSLLLVLGLGVMGCRQEAPSPWREMSLPLRHGEILPGADQNTLRVIYRGMGMQTEFYGEFQRALEGSGYTFERQGKEHDPAGKAYSGVFKKGGIHTLLTVTGDPDVTVELKRVE